MPERVHYKTIMFDNARWEGFAYRAGDIVISTPPKCGTTWTQMICALLIFQTSEFDRPLDVISPWVDMQTRSLDEILADLDAQNHRRFIKTHTPRDGLLLDDRVTYIAVGRDPRDVFLSWDNHLRNTDIIKLFTARERAVGLDDVAERLADGPPVFAETEIERFWNWVDDDTPVTEAQSLRATLHHLQTFWAARADPNVVLLHYDDLSSDLEGEMRALAHRLDVAVPEERWPELVAAASFEHMRARADVLAPETTSDIWQNNAQFFNSGECGQWKRLLQTGDDLARYSRRIAALTTPEFAGWVHGGRAVTPTDTR
jgi:aryl sulfotransferase